MKNLHHKGSNSKINYHEVNSKFSVLDLLSTTSPILKDIGVTEVIFEKKNSTNRVKQFKVHDQFGSNRVLVYLKEKGQDLAYPKYFNSSLTNDKGDVIQFITNRLKSKSQKEAIGLLDKYNYTNWKNENNYTVKHTIKQEDKKQIEFHIENYAGLISANELIELEEPHFLNTSRHISNDTFMHPNFKDTLMYYTIKTKTGLTLKNALFQKFDKDGELKGAEIKGFKKFNACHGEDFLCAKSNKPLITEKIVLVESFVDAYSHFELDPLSNENTLYYSTNGNLYEERLDFILEDIEREGIDLNKVNLTLAFDNDFDGLKYDLMVFSKLFVKNESYNIEAFGGTGKIAIQFFAYMDIYGKERFKEVEELFKEMAYKLNEVGLKKGDSEIIKIVSWENEGKIHLVFPNKSRINRASKGISVFLANRDTNIKSKRVVVKRAQKVNDFNDELRLKKQAKKEIKNTNEVHQKKSV